LGKTICVVVISLLLLFAGFTSQCFAADDDKYILVSLEGTHPFGSDIDQFFNPAGYIEFGSQTGGIGLKISRFQYQNADGINYELINIFSGKGSPNDRMLSFTGGLEFICLSKGWENSSDAFSKQYNFGVSFGFESRYPLDSGIIIITGMDYKVFEGRPYFYEWGLRSQLELYLGIGYKWQKTSSSIQ
jgi:hypothetical protein